MRREIRCCRGVRAATPLLGRTSSAGGQRPPARARDRAHDDARGTRRRSEGEEVAQGRRVAAVRAVQILCERRGARAERDRRVAARTRQRSGGDIHDTRADPILVGPRKRRDRPGADGLGAVDATLQCHARSLGATTFEPWRSSAQGASVAGLATRPRRVVDIWSVLPLSPSSAHGAARRSRTRSTITSHAWRPWPSRLGRAAGGLRSCPSASRSFCAGSRSSGPAPGVAS